MKKYNFTSKDHKTGAVKECGYMTLDSISDNESGEPVAELRFYGDICSESWMSRLFEEDKAPQDVVDFLSELTADGSNRPLHVYVNSGGGDVFGGLAIYSILSRYQGRKVAHIDGIAASIAGIIPFACDKVVAPKYAQIMLHKPWTFCIGNADDMKKTIEALNAAEQSIVSIYASHAANGTNEDKIRSLIDRETWLTCEKAAEYFDIELVDAEPVAACVSDSYKLYKHTPEALIKEQKQPNAVDRTDSGSDKQAENEQRKKKLKRSLDLLKLFNKT